MLNAEMEGVLRPASPPHAWAWSLLRLCRLYYALPLGFTLGLTIVYARDARMIGEWPATLAASVALALVVAAGYVFNDVCDRTIDRINARHRPIAAGDVPAGVACGWAALLFAAGLTLATAWCRPAFVAWIGVVAAGLVAYDLVSKRAGLGKQVLVAVLMTSIYPLAGLQAGGITGSRAATLLFFPVWLFLTSFGYEVLKDIRDRHGDRVCSGRSNWIARNPIRARKTASLLIVAGSAVLIVPGFVGCGTVYISIIIVAIAAAVASTVLSLRPALGAIYLECVLVGIAATTDLLW